MRGTCIHQISRSPSENDRTSDALHFIRKIFEVLKLILTAGILFVHDYISGILVLTYYTFRGYAQGQTLKKPKREEICNFIFPFLLLFDLTFHLS